MILFTAGIKLLNSRRNFIVGDFNAELSKISSFGSILCDFCHDNSFTIADKEYLPADTYNYVSSAWGTTSWLYHIVCTADRCFAMRFQYGDVMQLYTF